MYKNSYEQKKIPLDQLCMDKLSYTVDTGSNCRRWRALKGPAGQKIVVRTTPAPSGDYLFFSRENPEIRGSVFELLRMFHGYASNKEILANFFGDSELPKYKPTICAAKVAPENSTKEVKRVYDNYLDRCTIGVYNYLTRRGISNKLVREYSIPVAERELFIPLYCLRNSNWEVATGITYSFDLNGDKKHPRFEKGLDRRGSYSLLMAKKRPLNEYDTLRIFESPIDALSYVQLFPDEKKAILLSFCGAHGGSFSSQLLLLLKKLKLAEVVICVDNDDRGRGYEKDLRKLIKGVKVSSKFPVKKDWNDDLNGATVLKPSQI